MNMRSLRRTFLIAISLAAMLPMESLAERRVAPSTRVRLKSPYDPKKVHPPITNEPLLTAARSKGRPHGYLSSKQYEGLRDIAFELIQKYPPHKYQYVGIGRSMTAIVAFLQNLEVNALSIPTSNLKTGAKVALSDAWRLHLDRFLSRDLRESGRAILLMDRVNTGASLSTVQQLFTQYLAEHRLAVPVEVVAFTKHPQVTLPKIDINEREVAPKMNHFEPFAEWPHYEVGATKVSELVRQPAYEPFRAALMERMRRDPALGKLQLEWGE